MTMFRPFLIPAASLALILVLGVAHNGQADSSGIPFTQVSAQACGACHGPAGLAPRVDMSQGNCASCHAEPHGGSGSHNDGGSKSHGGGLITIANSLNHHGQVSAGSAHGQFSTDNMVLIPAGPVIVGSDGREITEGKGNLDETPEHEVTLPDYYIDIYEVTNRRYKRFTDATGHRLPRHWKHGIPEGKNDPPVVYVSWHDADEFCQWEGKRLPDELEWEKAARGTDAQVFPWGNIFSLDKANTPQRWASLKEKGGTMPVGSFKNGVSPYGLYDMSGNVWEWTQNWYLPYPGNDFPNHFYGEKNKVLRGGSWYDCLSYGCGLSAPSFNRSRFAPKIRNNSFGFRCAADARHDADARSATDARPDALHHGETP